MLICIQQYCNETFKYLTDIVNDGDHFKQNSIGSSIATTNDFFLSLLSVTKSNNTSVIRMSEA